MAGLCPAYVAAETFADGRAAYLQRDYSKAYSIWKSLADAGAKEAQFGLGTLYHEGSGVTADPKKATEWFRKAADQGFAPAQFNLGNAYHRGDGVPHSEALASSWWKRSADQEFAPAQFNLATQYYFGKGVPRDRAIAVIYYRRAAQNGHPTAGEILARLEQEESTVGAAGAGSSRGGSAGTSIAATARATSPSATAPRSQSSSQASASQRTSAATATRRPEAPRARPQTAAPPKRAVVASHGQDAGWVASQQPSNYTVQLVALGSEEAAKAYISKHSWPAPVGYVPVARGSKRFYSVLFGSFDSANGAKAAFNDLPTSIKGKVKPWVRRFSSIKPAQ